MPIGDGSPSNKMDSTPTQSNTNNSMSSNLSDSCMKTESASSSSLSMSSCSGGDGEGNKMVAGAGDIGLCSSSKPHRGNDVQWVAIHLAKSKSNGELGVSDFRLLKKLGFGDIGSVYMADLRGGRGGCLFVMKVMDKESLAAQKKLMRARTEWEIPSLLDHPFLPTLYSHFETDEFSCWLMEFCSGGDLPTLFF